MDVHRPRYVVLVLTLLAPLLLSGCHTIAASEYADFKAQAPNQRAMNQVNLTWDVRPDAAEYCSKIAKKAGAAMAKPAVACATWSVQTQQCTIITTPNPSHVVIGHEVRHCFEGHFH